MKVKHSNYPDTLPVNGHDICNYLARYGTGNYLIQAVLKLDGRLDFEKLSKAVRLSIVEEPVLGCRFVEGNPPYWKRIDNIDETMLCSYEETSDPDAAVKRYSECPLSMDKDPMVKVRLISSGEYDTLFIKINHACCDGAGSKDYIQLLSKIYSSIVSEGIYIPNPKIGGRKDQDKLISELGIRHPELKWNPHSITPKRTWSFPWMPWRTDSIRFSVRQMPSGQLDVMSRYGKARGATINDLLLTAFYRAMFKISKPVYGVPMDISSTIDLRRYLPGQRAEAIRNLSGGFLTRIPRVKGEDFEGTLSRLLKETKKVKDGHPGLQNVIGGEYVEKMPFPHLRAHFKSLSIASRIASMIPSFNNNACCPGISNFGFVSKSLIKFGDIVVTDAYILPPVVRAPGFLLLACTYNGIMTLVLGYYKASICRKDVDRLLNKIRDELIKGCK